MAIAPEERFNVVTSLIGVAAAPPAVVLLLTRAVEDGDPWKIASIAVYGTTLLILYTVTLLFHAVQGSAREYLNTLDHCAIFLLIAGTYTPFSLVTLRGPWGWALFGLVWGAAGYGVVQQLRPGLVPHIPEMALYLGMGWLILVALRPLLHALPWQGFLWIAIGGIFYTGGTVFFALDKRFARAHGIWHVCVLAGSASHYLAVLRYVA
jgi:hemolysin III